MDFLVAILDRTLRSYDGHLSVGYTVYAGTYSRTFEDFFKKRRGTYLERAADEVNGVL